jgi:hypothetical protein
VGLHTEHFAHLSNGGPRLVADHCGGHGSAVSAVFFEDVLDDAFALRARWQVEVDVGPFAAFFREKTLEQELHGDGVDRGDAQRIAYGAIRGGTAPLTENPLLFGEAGDVVDDEEVTGKIELRDEVELVFELRTHSGAEGLSVAVSGSGKGELAQPGRRILAGGAREIGKAVAEIAHGVGATSSDLRARADPLGTVGEARRHALRGQERALAIARQESSGRVERSFFAETRERVEEPPTFGQGAADISRRHDGDTERFGEGRREKALSERTAVAVAANFDPEAPGKECPRAIEKCLSECTVTGDQRDQPRGVLFEGVLTRVGLSLRRVVLRPGQEPREIAIPATRFHQQTEARRGKAGAANFERGADQRSYAGLPGRLKEARRAVEPVAVGEGQGAVPQLRGAIDQVFGIRDAFEKRKRAATGQLHVLSGELSDRHGELVSLCFRL